MSTTYRAGLIGCGRMGATIDDEVKGRPNAERYLPYSHAAALVACDRMRKRPHEMIFLDDIGPNLKPPRAMGMATIKVETPEQALGELAPLVGLTFRTI